MITARAKFVSGSGQFWDIQIEAVTNAELLDEALNFEGSALELGFQPFTVAQAPAVGNGAVPATAPSTDQVVPKEQANPGDLAARFRSAVIEVSPRPDGKAQVAFYGADIKPPKNDFPYVTNVYKPETWVDRFASVAEFTVEDFQKTGQYALVADIEVRYGKNKTQHGNYYKDLSAITPSPGVGLQEVEEFEVVGEVVSNDPEDIPF